MQRLEDKELIRGVGREVYSSFVKRNGKVCFYQRSDDPYEVFIVQVRKAEKIKGVDYPEREIYPSNEDFGKTAWCYSNFTLANKRFNKLVES